MSRFDIRTRTGLISPIIQGAMGAYFDADASAFFDRVSAAGGSLTLTEQNAIDALVVSLKANNIWTSMLAIYPMVGGSAAACAQNLKSSSFTGTFSGGWTYASTGVTPNGTNAYMDTTLVPNTNLTLNNVSFSVYSRNNFTPTSIQDFGVSSSSSFLPILGMSILVSKGISAYIYNFGSSDLMQAAAGQNLAAMFIATRTAANSGKLFRNSAQIASSVTQGQTTQPTTSFLFGAFRNSTGVQGYNTFQYAFAHIGAGLSDTQSSNFYTAVQTFQTSLSRNV